MDWRIEKVFAGAIWLGDREIFAPFVNNPHSRRRKQMRKKRFCVFGVVFIIGLILLTLNVAQAQDFPKRPIQVVVAFAAGGETDLICRLAGQYLSKNLGQPIVVLNKPGGTVAVAADYCLKAPADGYTLFAIAQTFVVAPFRQKMPYVVSDFVGLVELAKSNCLIVVRKDAPWANFKEFIEDAKKHPGTYFYGIPSVGGVQALWWEIFKNKAGMKIAGVPYAGAAPEVAALLGGDIQIAQVDAPIVLPHLKAGTLKALAVGEKDPNFPGVMTFQEQGFEGNFVIWRALAVRQGTPKKAYDILEDACKKVLNDKAYVEGLAKMGSIPGTMTGETFDKFVNEQHKLFGEIIQKMPKE